MGWEEHLRGRQLSQNTSAFLVCMRLEAPQRAAPDLHTLNVIIMGDHQKKEIYFYALTHETNCIKHFDQAGLNLIQIFWFQVPSADGASGVTEEVKSSS